MRNPTRFRSWARVMVVIWAGTGLVATAVLLRRPAAASSLATTSIPSVVVSSTTPSTVKDGSPPAAQVLVDGYQPSASSMVPITADNGQVVLLLAPLADGKARYYTLAVNGKAIPFFVLRSSDGVIRAAIDACDVCFPAHKGYRQEGDVMVCNNCNSRFPSVKINVETGGCNPAPLPAEIRGESVIIRAADIVAGARYF